MIRSTVGFSNPGTGGTGDGAQGTTGAQGAQGSAGEAIYEGIQGTQGTQGTQGSEGAQGLEGSGTQGVQGTQGAEGAQGLEGEQGETGAQGTRGTQGETGIQGAMGAAGAGVAAGGTARQILGKVDSTDYNTGWIDNYAEKTYFLVRNNTGSTILKGTLVSATGAEPSGRIDVAPFSVTGTQDSELRVMGMATNNISNGVNGEVISFGTLIGVDTRGSTASALAVGDETWAEGDILYAHPTVAGKLTKVIPQHDLAVAFITVRHASAGQIAIRIVPENNHLEWMHDVEIDTPADNEVLAFDSASGLWKNQTASEAGLATSAPLTLSQSSNNANYPLTISSANEQGGGAGWVDIMKLINSKSGATNSTKHIRMNSSGGLEIVNNAYSSTIFSVSDSGNVNAAGSYNGASLGDTGWISISSFQNSYSGGGSPAYRKINNVVYLRGRVSGGTSNTTAFNLPANYRPAVDTVITVQQFGTANLNYVTVQPDGNVIPNGNAAWLSSVIFPTG